MQINVLLIVLDFIKIACFFPKFLSTFFFRWYLKAQQLNPKNGRPYNQLALLAHYAVCIFILQTNK